MANIEKSLGRKVDWPQLEAANYAALAAGSATDPAQDILVTGLPALALSYGAQLAGQNDANKLPRNRMWVRQAGFISQGAANTVGNATHFADLRLNFYRLGKLQGCLAYWKGSVNTTIGTAVTVANAATTVTPAAMTGIVNGMQLAVDSSTSFEVVTAYNVTATTFTAFFTKTHTNAVAVTAILVPFQPISFVPACGPVSTNSASSTVAGAGSATITPATMYGIHVGDTLLYDTGGSAETVTVTAVTTTTFTATFANAHGASAPIVTATLANGAEGELQPGDVLALGRLSNDATGLATPVGQVYVEWVPSKIGG